ncbi:alpha-galactosidase [Pedobacter sp. BS3]|uniref:putative Ig domain-containing protein n=1 Tax=Pedobacter sp. BS3 TaxID=2567937 RepID=UPI0011ECBC4F|nr:putative Ig domain-containing protein [Pedobacter sp. BS3]TZF82282.1 alpha-galactosidase [Pedobacter sp. BS3]
MQFLTKLFPNSGLKRSMLLLIPGLLLLNNTLTAAPVKPASSWFDEMLQTCTSAKTEWQKNAKETWAALRAKYNSNTTAMLEMSWEERDNIWNANVPPENIYPVLAARYQRAYRTSCNERGVAPQSLDTNVVNLDGLKKVRAVYLQSRKAEYVILTPKPGSKPAINNAAVYGVRPGHELIYRVAATGKRPLTYSVKGLPAGCTFDKASGVIHGVVNKAGNYTLTLHAENQYGFAEKTVTLKVGDAIALTPPMGWNSWNSFACDVTAKDIINTADELIKTGLADYGWSYVNIDDCWMKLPGQTDMDKSAVKTAAEEFMSRKMPGRKKGNRIRFNEPEVTGNTRDANGNIISNADFKDMKGLTDYIHRYGLKAGLYISPGPLTCQCYEGSYGHETQDARQFADWGFDYLKYDWCSYGNVVEKPTLEQAIAPYKLMGDALKKAERDIVYSLCQYGRQDVWKWGPDVGGNCWRTTGDIRDTWASVLKIGFGQAGLESFAGPGHWNDPDMLVVGYVGWSKNLRPTYLSPNEQYTHITLWSLLASPLLIGCDLTRLDDFTRGLLTNAEVISVNQDALGKQAARMVNAGDVQVWVKQLADGTVAAGVFNTGDKPTDYTLKLSDLNLHGTYQVRDLWRQQDAGKTTGTFDVKLNRHGVQLYKLTKL